MFVNVAETQSAQIFYSLNYSTVPLWAQLSETQGREHICLQNSQRLRLGCLCHQEETLGRRTHQRGPCSHEAPICYPEGSPDQLYHEYAPQELMNFLPSLPGGEIRTGSETKKLKTQCIKQHFMVYHLIKKITGMNYRKFNIEKYNRNRSIPPHIKYVHSHLIFHAHMLVGIEFSFKVGLYYKCCVCYFSHTPYTIEAL